MMVLFIVIGIVFLIWIINLVIQWSDKKSREKYIKKKQEEKKKEEEEKNRTPFKR